MDVYTCVGKCTFDILLSFGLFHCKISGTLRHTTPYRTIWYKTLNQMHLVELVLYILYAYTCNYICSSFEVLNKRWNAINLITWKEASTNRTRMPLTRGIHIYIYISEQNISVLDKNRVELNWIGEVAFHIIEVFSCFHHLFCVGFLFTFLFAIIYGYACD